jgi:hypothetical protein
VLKIRNGGMMKRYLYLPMLAVMTFVLSGCLVLTDGTGGLNVQGARFETQYRLEENGQVRNYVVCNDLQTTLRYEFRFSGTVDSFEWYLRGDSGAERYRERIRRGDPGVSFDAATGTVRVERVLANGSPTLLAPQMVGETSDIVINPIAVIEGYSNLVVEILGLSQGYTVTFPGSKIAVVRNCGDF